MSLELDNEPNKFVETFAEFGLGIRYRKHKPRLVYAPTKAPEKHLHKRVEFFVEFDIQLVRLLVACIRVCLPVKELYRHKKFEKALHYLVRLICALVTSSARPVCKRASLWWDKSAFSTRLHYYDARKTILLATHTSVLIQ